jgi:Fur family ferric uptake transcriptional regulator
MSNPKLQLQQQLKGQGMNVTFARRRVFAALLAQETQTMNELIKACREIDRVSVYRTVALFEGLGIVVRRPIGWKYQIELSDAFHRHHHHLACSSCGQIVPLPADEIIENRLQAMAGSQGFYMDDHQLEIQGLCSNCFSR